MKSRDEQNRTANDAAAQDFERAAKANEAYSSLFKKRGLKVLSWNELSAWKEYVEGKISDPELDDKARVEIDSLDLAFGKYLVTEDDGSTSILKDPVKRARAKLANKIYRKICEEKSIEVCFFSDFSSWSDYVRGAIGESEFYRKAEEEVEQMLGAAA